MAFRLLWRPSARKRRDEAEPGELTLADTDFACFPEARWVNPLVDQ
ncbi:MAG: hypothetical protein OXG34_08850 [bacterium]|nr:hypothetical protein [bacterium]MCY3888985.1 hypothetical protein [bacterium]MCY3961759.1 hypothetical protein [bacterium]